MVGYPDAGELLTGNIDFFTVATLVPVFNTGVFREIEDLKFDLKVQNIAEIGGFTVHGRRYDTDSQYIDALVKQKNLNNFIKIVDTRATPIMLNVMTSGKVNDVNKEIPPNSHNGQFGRQYGPGQVYLIKFALEHPDAWTTNTLAAALDQKPAINTLDNVLPVRSWITNDNESNFDDQRNGTKYRNTVILKNNFT